jgi:hypothetical protein
MYVAVRAGQWTDSGNYLDYVRVCRNVEAAVVSACDFNDAQEVT